MRYTHLHLSSAVSTALLLAASGWLHAAEPPTPATAAAQKAPAIPLTVAPLGEKTVEPGTALHPQVTLTNLTGQDIPAEVEYVIQQDPALFDKVAAHPLYGSDIAAGALNWADVGGKIDRHTNMTDGKLQTGAGTPYNDKEKWAEASVYIDLGRKVRVVHMDYAGGDGGWRQKADFYVSDDGKDYKPVDGLQKLDVHKWGPQQVDVPQPFEGRFIRMRFHNDGGPRYAAISFPSEFHVFAGPMEKDWEFPQAGPVLAKGKLQQTVAAGAASTLELGDGSNLAPGSYFVAVRTKAAGLTQMNYGHIFVMPPALARITRDSRFGLNGIGRVGVSLRQGNGWNRFENLKWYFCSPAAGLYKFDGSVPPHVKFDELFRSYHEAGLFTVPYLSQTPPYLVPDGVKSGGNSHPPKDLSKFEEFAFQTVARYGSKKHPPEVLLTPDKVSGLGYLDTYELWNEADLNDPGWGAWRGPFNDFFIMYRYGAEGVKKADPDAKVVNGGWSGMDVPLMERMRNYKYPDGKCPLDFTDILSVHYYSFQVPPELARLNDNTYRTGSPLQEFTYEQSLERLVAWRDKYKPTMPVWLTETGYDSQGPKGTNERYQACWLPRDVMMALASGIDKVHVFRETGSGGALFESSGVIRNDGSLNPSWFTYATLIRQLDGITERAVRLPLADENARAYLWKQGDRLVLAAWAIQGSAKLDLALSDCTLTDAFGASSRVQQAHGMDLTEFPLYFSDFSAASGKALSAQVDQLLQAHQQRVQRQSKLQAYLFSFGRKDRGATMIVGSERSFTDVMAADVFDPAKGYGFETRGLQDQNAPWLRPPFSVVVRPGTRFTFQAKPGDYELRVCSRLNAAGTLVIRGIEGGDQTVAVEQPPQDGSTTVSLPVKAGDKPVTVEPAFSGALIWITMIERE